MSGATKARREEVRERLRAVLALLDEESAEEKGNVEQPIHVSSSPLPSDGEEAEPDTTDANDARVEEEKEEELTPPFVLPTLTKRPRPATFDEPAKARAPAVRWRRKRDMAPQVAPAPESSASPVAHLAPSTDPIPVVKNAFGLIMNKRWSVATKEALQLRFTPHSNKKNAHPRNARVRTIFTAKRHDYLLDGVKRSRANGWYSATGFMHMLFKEFDQDAQAEISSKGSNPKYAGKSPAEIKKIWDDNRDRASAIHRGADKWLQHEPLVPDAPSEETDWEEGEPVLEPPIGFYRLMESLAPRYDVYATEFTLYSERWLALGQIDLLLQDRVTGEVVLCDFKTYDDEDLASESDARDMGRHPFTAQWLDSRLSHCRFQLNFYREILEQEYGIKVSDTMFVFQFRPSDPDGYYVTRIERCPMDAFFALLPWRTDDPRHYTLADATLVPRVADDHPGCTGPTMRIKVTKGALPDDVVWAGFPYKSEKTGYDLPDTPWKPHRRWREKDPPPLLFSEYETRLLNNPELLRALPSLYGKRIACWCWKSETRCNADVLVKYANLVGGGYLNVEEALLK